MMAETADSKMVRDHSLFGIRACRVEQCESKAPLFFEGISSYFSPSAVQKLKIRPFDL